MLNLFLKMKKITAGGFDDHYLEFERNGDKYKKLSLAKNLDETRPYFKEMINNFITFNDT